MTFLLFLVLSLKCFDSDATMPVDDYLHHLLRTHPDLREVPQLSRTNMGADRMYIEKENGKAPYITMSFQEYDPGKGPTHQSIEFPVTMTAPEVMELTASEKPEE